MQINISSGEIVCPSQTSTFYHQDRLWTRLNLSYGGFASCPEQLRITHGRRYADFWVAQADKWRSCARPARRRSNDRLEANKWRPHPSLSRFFMNRNYSYCSLSICHFATWSRWWRDNTLSGRKIGAKISGEILIDVVWKRQEHCSYRFPIPQEVY